MGFAATLALAGATPGPATLSVLARALARGARGTIAFSAGLVIGDLFWLATAALGLAAVAEHAPFAMRALVLAGAAYVLVLAHGFWTAPPAHAGSSTRGRGLVQGLALQLGNPKVALFYMAFLPALVPLDRLTGGDFALLALVVASVVTAVNMLYITLAVAARRRATSPRSLRVLHRISAVVMVIAALLLAWSAS